MNKGIKVLLVLTMSLSLFACGKKDKNATTKKTNSKVETTKSHLTRANIREFETITYGTYPQTEEKDSAIISNLSSLAGTLPTNDDDALWTKFDNYFCETVYESIVHDPEYGDYTTYYAINGYMWYIDLDINSDGTYDYRGIYFSEPRAANYFGYEYYGRSNQGNSGYSKNTAYWFKYEPIEWIILDNKDGKKLVMSKLSIDSFGYNSTMEAYYNMSYKYDHNGGTGYCSNYELSELRRWTNNDFYSLAFTLAEQEKIRPTLIDNSKESFFGKPRDLYCENTNDKIFYLSLKEASIYFDSDEERQTKGTDYAKASGVLVDQDGNASWMLRSPRNTYFCYHYCIYPRGFGYATECFSAEVGIRPVMWIDAN